MESNEDRDRVLTALISSIKKLIVLSFFYNVLF